MHTGSIKIMTEQMLLDGALVDEQFLVDIPRRRKRPSWILTESVALVGAWETLFHRRRVGGGELDDEKSYAYEHSEDFVLKVKELGANILITAFSKNYYIDKEEFKLKLKLAEYCRKHKLRLGTYIRPDYIYSEYFTEIIKDKDILAFDADGNVGTYGDQEWRESLCLHKPDTIEMFKSDIRRAILELKVDALHIDGFIIGHMETMGACRCSTCRKDFTKFLIKRYGSDPEACCRRFGHTNLEAIKPPGMKNKPAMPSGAVNNPVWQEWIIFRCTWTARIARLISEYVYELNPNVAIMTNSGVAVKENLPLLMGSTPEIIGEYSDVIMNEDAYGPSVTDEGQIIQRARQHKIVNQTGAWLWNYMGANSTSLEVGFAHAAAFNRGRVTCIAMMGGSHCIGMSEESEEFKIKRSFMKWLKENWDFYQNLEDIAEIAVWREQKAMAFADPLTYATATRVEQLLIEDRIPFTITSGQWPSTIKVLILPNLTNLGSEQCKKVVEFINHGGSVLVIGTTSLRDSWGRQYSDFNLRSILPEIVACPTSHSSSQHIAAANVPVVANSFFADSGDCSCREIASGRVAYISSIVDETDLPPFFNLDNSINLNLDTNNWKIPEKADELRNILSWLTRDSCIFTVDSSRGVIANYYQQEHTGIYFIHLVNLTGKTAQHTEIKAMLPSVEYTVKSMSPYSGDGENLSWSQKNDELKITLKSLKTYTIIEIAKKV
jgi:hypothetical protein